jgi:Domain of unknown function (DUF4190)
MTLQTTTGEVYPASRTSTLAVISLVAGILGWSLFPILGCVVAIITGIMARNEIRESGGTITGSGFATAGLILGWAGVLVSICGLCAFGVCLPLSICGGLLGLSIPVYYTTSALPFAAFLL